ncbi:hypothetical protein [Crocinitomix catalasitica]|uniref:hypothetical protein n=1 Tax=Crocinitomix catalasitica TaxID=184607 RepID=UPI00048A1B40|nr:hypothetical protein [Crocinitomix catalasitica]
MKTVIALFFLYSLTGKAQTQNLTGIDSVYSMLENYDNTSLVNKSSNDELIWMQIDTFTVHYYNSALKGGTPKLDTITIKLRFENNWDSLRIEQTKNQNQILINQLSFIYRNYMDSIDWRGYKITKGGFESDKVGHLKMKYPIPFTEIQKSKIDLIQRCPDFLFEGMGVFLDCNNPGIREDNIRISYTNKLRYISNAVFRMDSVNYGKKNY